MSVRVAAQGLALGGAAGAVMYLSMRETIFAAHQSILDRVQPRRRPESGGPRRPSIGDVYSSTTPIPTRVLDRAAMAWNSAVMKAHHAIVKSFY